MKKALIGISVYAIGIAAMLLLWQAGVRFLSSPGSEVIKMEWHELNPGEGTAGI